MKKIGGIGFAVLAILLFTQLGAAQDKSATRTAAPEKPATADNAPLILTAQIPLPGVHGRFDHFTFDPAEPARILFPRLATRMSVV